MKKRRQQIQPGYNQTHTLENRSAVSSHLNQTGRVNDPLMTILDKMFNLFIFLVKAKGNTYTKFGEIWSCFSEINEQTDTQTDCQTCIHVQTR